MLVFHVDLVVLVADQEQIAVRILRADGVALPQAVKGQDDRILHIQAVAQLGVGGLNAEHHVRETQQGNFDRLEQDIGPDGLGQLDGVARDTRAVVWGTI